MTRELKALHSQLLKHISIAVAYRNVIGGIGAKLHKRLERIGPYKTDKYGFPKLDILLLSREAIKQHEVLRKLYGKLQPLAKALDTAQISAYYCHLLILDYPNGCYNNGNPLPIKRFRAAIKKIDRCVDKFTEIKTNAQELLHEVRAR